MQESGDVRQALLRFYEAFSAGDAAGFERVVSRDEARLKALGVHAMLVGESF